MNWESLIGPLIVVALALLGGYGWMRDLRAKFEASSAENGRRFTESETDRRELRKRLEELDRECVKGGRLTEVKAEIIDRIKEVEHALRGSQTTAIGEMRDMMKSLLERALGARP